MSFAVLGAMQLKNGICYTYAFELVELKNKPMVCTAINIWDVSTLMWINLYILYVSRNWWYIMAAYTTLGCVAWTILVMFGHESPKWMMMDGRSNDCKEELKKIALFNGSTEQIKFLASGNFLEPSCLSKRSKKSYMTVMSSGTHLTAAAVEGMLSRLPLIPKHTKILEDKLGSDEGSTLSATSSYLAMTNAKSLRTVQMLMISLFVVFNLGYLLTYFNLTNGGGDVFVMGLVLGFAEAISSVVSGWLMIKFGEKFAFNFLATEAIICYLILYYARDFLMAGTGIGGVIFLFFSMIGVGGAYNTIFIIIESELPPEWLAQTVSLSFSFCTLIASSVP